MINFVKTTDQFCEIEVERINDFEVIYLRFDDLLLSQNAREHFNPTILGALHETCRDFAFLLL